MNDFQRAGGTAVAPEPQAETVTGQIVTPEEVAAIKAEREEKINPFVDSAKSITIEDAEDAEGATEVLAEIARRLKSLEEERKGLVAPINEAKNRVQNLYNGLKAPLEEARNILQPKLIAFQEAEEERVRQENIKREQELQAKRRAEEERIAAGRKAALEASKAATAEAQKATEALAETGDAEAEAKALEAAEAARIAAEELAAKREERPAFELAEREEASATVKTTSGSFTVKKVWTGEVVDESLVPREYLVVDQTKINAAVKAGQRSIPGVNIYQKSIGSTRA